MIDNAKTVRDVICECICEVGPSLCQVMHMLNNCGMVDKIKSSNSHVSQSFVSGKNDDEGTDLVDLLTLSSRPTSSERDVIRNHLAKVADRRVGFHDLQYGLLNSNEFLLRH